MKITVENKEIINSREISIHDGEMGPITYNYEDKSCIFEVLNPEWDIRQTFHVKGILYIEVQPVNFGDIAHTSVHGTAMSQKKEQKNYFAEKLQNIIIIIHC